MLLFILKFPNNKKTILKNLILGCLKTGSCTVAGHTVPARTASQKCTAAVIGFLQQLSAGVSSCRQLSRGGRYVLCTPTRSGAKRGRGDTKRHVLFSLNHFLASFWGLLLFL